MYSSSRGLQSTGHAWHKVWGLGIELCQARALALVYIMLTRTEGCSCTAFV